MPENKLSEFTLDLRSLNSGDIITSHDNFKDGFVGNVSRNIYNSILRIYQDKRDDQNQKKIDALNTVKDDIENLMIAAGKSELLDKKNHDKMVSDTSSNSDDFSHLAFIYHVLNNNGNEKDVIDGYQMGNKNVMGLSEKFTKQFIKDLPRGNVKVVDQNGNELFEGKNLDKVINEQLDKEGKESTNENYLNKMQEILHLSPEQLRFVVTNFNQKNIDGMAANFSLRSREDDLNQNLDHEELGKMPDTEKGVSNERKNFFHVNIDDNTQEIQSTQKIEHQSGWEVIDSDSLETKKKHSVTYNVDISNIPRAISYGQLVFLPIDVPTAETVTYKGKIPGSGYPLSPELKRKVSNVENDTDPEIDRAMTNSVSSGIISPEDSPNSRKSSAVENFFGDIKRKFTIVTESDSDSSKTPISLSESPENGSETQKFERPKFLGLNNLTPTSDVIQNVGDKIHEAGDVAKNLFSSFSTSFSKKPENKSKNPRQRG